MATKNICCCHCESVKEKFEVVHKTEKADVLTVHTGIKDFVYKDLVHLYSEMLTTYNILHCCMTEFSVGLLYRI